MRGEAAVQEGVEEKPDVMMQEVQGQGEKRGREDGQDQRGVRSETSR